MIMNGEIREKVFVEDQKVSRHANEDTEEKHEKLVRGHTGKYGIFLTGSSPVTEHKTVWRSVFSGSRVSYLKQEETQSEHHHVTALTLGAKQVA